MQLRPNRFISFDEQQKGSSSQFCDQSKASMLLLPDSRRNVCAAKAGKKLREENPMFSGDLGFRVFKLASSNIQAWEPDRQNLAQTLEASVDHLKTDRTESDILFELLLKLGLDLTVPIEKKSIAGQDVQSIGAGTLIVCLSKTIAAKEIEALALGIAEWHKAQAPSGESTVVFRDSAFADDVAKNQSHRHSPAAWPGKRPQPLKHTTMPTTLPNCTFDSREIAYETQTLLSELAVDKSSSGTLLPPRPTPLGSR